MTRLLPAVVLAILIAPAARAQEKPSAAQQQAVAGTWALDSAHSDAVTNSTFSGGGGMRGGFGGAASHAPSGGGGRKGGGAPLPQPGASPAVGMGGGSAAPAPLRDPKLQLLATEGIPASKLLIAINDSAVSLANGTAMTSWKTDGTKHQDVQMDGSIIEMTGAWSNGTLTLLHSMVGTASLKREFKIGKDGELTVKETVEFPGGRKTDSKLVYTRQP